MVIQAGVGMSHHRNPRLAGTEAATQAMKKANIDKPDFVFMFASVGYPQKPLLEGVRNVTDNAPLCGCSGEGIITNEEVDESNFSVAVMVIQSDELQFMTGMATDMKKCPHGAGNVVGNTIQNTLSSDTIALFLFADGLTFNFDRFMAGLNEKLDPSTSLPIFGGVSADNWEFKQTYQYCNDQVISDGVVWATLSGSVRLAWAVSHGCVPIGGRRTITKAKGNIIYEIDNKPALDILKEYLIGGEIENWQRTVINFCLGFKAPSHLKNEYDEYLIRFIPSKDDHDGSITIQTEVENGDHIWMTRRDHNKIAHGIDQIVQSIQHQLQGATPQLVFQFDCCGRGKVVFRDQPKKELLQSLQQIAPTTPWIGLYTLGEIGPVAGHNCFHNYTAVLAAIY